MTASLHVGNAILDCYLRGVAPAVPTGVFVSLHTADPGIDGANEVALAAWPGYVRLPAAAGGAIDTGFTAAAAKLTHNALQLLWPDMDGAAPVTVGHACIWDAATGGNCLLIGYLVDPRGDQATRTLDTGDQLRLRAGDLILSVT